MKNAASKKTVSAKSAPAAKAKQGKVRRSHVLPIAIAGLFTLIAVKGIEVTRVLPMPHIWSGSALASAPTPAPAPARAPAAAPAPAAPTAAPATAPAAAPAAPAAAPQDQGLLDDLRARRQQLEQREQEASAKEAVLAAMERRITERVAELDALRQRLEQAQHAAQQRDEQAWSGLVKTYEAMRPRDAATIFNELDMTVLVEVLDRMKETRAAPVLAVMQPERARQATMELARRRTASLAR